MPLAHVCVLVVLIKVNTIFLMDSKAAFFIALLTFVMMIKFFLPLVFTLLSVFVRNTLLSFSCKAISDLVTHNVKESAETDILAKILDIIYT